MNKGLIWIGCLLGAGLVTGLLAEDKARDPNQVNHANQQAQDQAAQKDQNSRQAADQDAMLKLSPDQRFLSELYKSNLFEIAFAQLVLDKGRTGGQQAAAGQGAGASAAGNTANQGTAGSTNNQSAAANSGNSTTDQSGARISGTPTSRNPGADAANAHGKMSTTDLAQMLITDHTKANDQVMQLARSKNLQLDKQMEDWQQAKIQHLSRLPANELNNCFVFDQVGHHQSDILKLRFQSTNAQEADVKQLAGQLLPTMQKHLDHSSQASAQLVGGSINFSGSGPGGTISNPGSGTGSTGDRSREGSR